MKNSIRKQEKQGLFGPIRASSVTNQKTDRWTDEQGNVTESHRVASPADSWVSYDFKKRKKLGEEAYVSRFLNQFILKSAASFYLISWVITNNGTTS